jgi:hypothetical protein
MSEMFSFLKKLIPQDQISQHESVGERALKLFSIESLDDIKEMMLRAIKSQERVHTLLTGAPGLCKIIVHVGDRKIHAIQSLLCRGCLYHQGGITELYS